MSLVGTAAISMALGVVTTAYIMKRHYSSTDNVDQRKSLLSRRRRPSSDCISNSDNGGYSNSDSGDSGDKVAPLEKMQKRLSAGYNILAGRRSILLSEEDNTSRSSSPRRLYSSITRDSDIDSHDSLTSGCSASDLDGRAHTLLHSQRSRSLERFDSKPSKVVTREESYISETEIQFKGEDEFGESILQNIENLPDSLQLLRRTRAISALSSRLMEARDEAECIEEASRLLALMFDLDRVSFGMVTGTDHFVLKRVLVTRNIEKSDLSPSSFELEVMDSDFQRPLEGTACGVACRTLKEHYAPRTKDSPFDTHKALYELGFLSTLTVPILVNGKKCAGAILIPKTEVDGFSKQSRVLISDIACILGSNLYSKRLRKASEESNKISRQILNSFVPRKVLEKIECYWNEPTKSTHRRKSEQTFASFSSVGSFLDGSDRPKVGSNAWYVANADWTEAKADKKFGRKVSAGAVNNGIQSKLQLLRKMTRQDDDSGSDDVGVILQSGAGIVLSPTRALYAENARNVCIVFTDIVGFSRIAMGIAPIKVMDMLQDLFNRFDELCDLHGVMKLETIGDAYICATNLLEDEDDEEDNNSAKDAAIRALAIAKDMVCEARCVSIPCPDGVCEMHDAWVGQNAVDFETLEIRVGIHVGDVTCGVLGQKMPKFMTCGTAVNMAARMEQTSLPSMIRATREFHDMVGDAETNWSKKEVIQLKNMGEMETYLLDPISHVNFE